MWRLNCGQERWFDDLHCQEFQVVEVELDVKVVVEWLVGQYNMNTAHSLFISDCRYFLGLIPRVKVNHFFQEAN